MLLKHSVAALSKKGHLKETLTTNLKSYGMKTLSYMISFYADKSSA